MSPAEIDRTRTVILGAVGTASGIVPTIVMQHVSSFISVLAGAAGITVSVVTAHYLIKSNRARLRLADLKILEEQIRVCSLCRRGKPPAQCPMPPESSPNPKPGNCPLNNPNRNI